MKNSQQTPTPCAAAMNDRLFEAFRTVVFQALSQVQGDEPVMLEIFPDAAGLMLKSAKPDTSTDGDFTRKQPLEGGRVFGMTEVEMQSVLQRCIDADRPLRLLVVRSDLIGLNPAFTSLSQNRTSLQ